MQQAAAQDGQEAVAGVHQPPLPADVNAVARAEDRASRRRRASMAILPEPRRQRLGGAVAAVVLDEDQGAVLPGGRGPPGRRR